MLMKFRSLVKALSYVHKQINEIYEKKFNGIGHIMHNCIFNHYTFLNYEDVTRNKLLYKLLLESKFAKDEEMYRRGDRVSPPIDYVLVRSEAYDVIIYRWESDKFVDKLIAKYVVIQIRFFRTGEWVTHVDDFYFVYFKPSV